MAAPGPGKWQSPRRCQKKRIVCMCCAASHCTVAAHLLRLRGPLCSSGYDPGNANGLCGWCCAWLISCSEALRAIRGKALCWSSSALRTPQRLRLGVGPSEPETSSCQMWQPPLLRLRLPPHTTPARQKQAVNTVPHGLGPLKDCCQLSTRINVHTIASASG